MYVIFFFRVDLVVWLPGDIQRSTRLPVRIHATQLAARILHIHPVCRPQEEGSRPLASHVLPETAKGEGGPDTVRHNLLPELL
jgi:hypothetical protein